MHRVLPGCTYGCIPKVQGAHDGHVVSPVPAVLEPRAPCTSKVRLHAASKRWGKAHLGPSRLIQRVQRASHVARKPCCGPRGRKRLLHVSALVDGHVRMLSAMSAENISTRGFLPHTALRLMVVPRDPSAVPSLSLVVCPSVAPERNFPYGCLSHPKEPGGGVYHPSV